jgi:predicted ATPase
MESVSQEESPGLDPDGRNFSSWYRYLAQAHPEVTSAALHALRDVIPGIQHLRFETMGESKRLEVSFEHIDRPLPFSQLSDGQRALIALYSLLHSIPSLGYSLFIDEPDNYVCLREIQPWLLKLEDLCTEQDRQAILISHHPEIINPLARDHGIWLSRPNNGPVRARKDYPVVDGLTAAETMARGWDDE